ncbi:hypothetical protein QTP88_001409 [Uroleucon formosanum]
MNNRSDDKDEFETVAKETLDKIIEVLEQDEINNTGSELIESVELDKLVEELDTFDEEIFNDNVENKPISSDVLNKSLRLINLDEFENSPTTNATRQGLRSNRNTIHTEYIQPKRTVKTKKMTGGSEMKPLNAIEAIKLIPDYSGQTEIYPFLNACEVIINTVDADEQPFMLKMIAATKLSDRAFNATRYKKIKIWKDMKKILLDAFETPYAAANQQIELNIIKMRYDETICAYNNRVEEIYQKLCNAVAIDKTPAEAKILRNNIREQALVSYINGLNDKLKFEVKTKNPTTLEQAMQIAIIAEKNIRTYNDVQEIFRTKNTSNTLTHKINIPENQEPIYKRPYPHAQMAEIDSQIKQMEKDDIIEPSFSPWNAPLLLVKKKLDASQIPKFRIVVDFRALNKVTINEYHPLPNITEIFDQLGQCNLFSIIDLASGFYQIKLDEKSKELTAFSTNQGHWHFKKMAMGLKTSPCSFQRLMNNVMAGIVGIKCLVYLDDIIIYGKGLLDHNEKLRDVFERLRNHNLKIQPTKCEFLKQQCMYLGHIISENGIQPDPEKIKSVLLFPIPASNLYYILQYPDFTKPFIVTTDASGKALGAILSQGEVSQDLPIAYASRTLSKCEKEYDYEIKYKPGVLNSNVDALSRMYTIHEIKESYPAFLNKFETQLITNKRVKEVNGSLIESPEEYHIVSEIEKHYNFMSGVNYEIKQKFGNGQKLAPSKEIGEVNYLRDKDRYIIFLTTKSRNKQKATYENIYLSLLNLKLLCEKHSLNKLAMNKLGFIDQLEWTQVRAMIRYVFRNTDIDVIICSKLEFTDEEKLMIFKQCHDSIIGGHVGIHRTIKKIKTQFNWRGLKEDVIEYIKNCESCQKGKVANKKVKQPMLITSTSSEPFEKIFLDIVGPLVTTLSGNTYKLTLQDDLTKYSMGIALPNHQANTIAEAFVTNFVEIPIKLSHEPEPSYNYDNYYFDLKQKMQESHKIAKENLIKRKVKSKQIYDNNENSIEIHVKDQILLRDKTQKNKLNPLWIGPYEMALAQTKPYRISRLTQENGMYFENQGPLRLTNSDWKLLIYVKLDNFNQRTKDTMDFYKRTLIISNDLTIAYEGMFKTTCDNFKLTSNSLEREVSRKRFYILQSIDETDTVTREKRGLVNLVGRVQKTLFGTLDDTDAELYDRQIEKLQSSQQNLLKIIDKQTSVLKATANTFKEANKMEAQINRLSVLYNRIADTVNQTVINLDIVEARTNINEQINILNLLFQQLSFETDTICEIIIAAQGGIMHSSVIAVNELRQQLKDISLIVPKEQSLPFNLNQVSLYELSKISKFNIIYKNETLIFEIIIPLVNSVELTLYHVILLPVVKNDHYIHIMPEYSYIAISKTHEYYLTLCMNHLMLCRQTNMGTLCPETQPLRLGASELPCEVELFVKPSSIPISCPIHYVDITRSIYHRLKYQNAWIYTIKTTDNVAVSCENRDQAINIQLTGNGVLTLNED